jgi:hypothetical protein
MTILWPIHRLPARDITAEITSRSLAAPSSISGVQQVVSSDAGLWRITLGSVVVNNRERVLAFRAIANLLEGRLGKILIPLCRGYNPSSGHKDLFEPVPHSDESPFDDDSEYVGSATSVQLTSDVAARSTSANIVVNYSVGDIEPGQHFSLGGERLYRVRSIVYTTPSTAALTFRPPLREAAAEGDFLEFDSPVVRSVGKRTIKQRIQHSPSEPRGARHRGDKPGDPERAMLHPLFHNAGRCRLRGNRGLELLYGCVGDQPLRLVGRLQLGFVSFG